MQYHRPQKLADKIGYTKQGVYLLIKQKKIKHELIDGVIFVPDDEFQSVIARFHKIKQTNERANELNSKYYMFPRINHVPKT